LSFSFFSFTGVAGELIMPQWRGTVKRKVRSKCKMNLLVLSAAISFVILLQLINSRGMIILSSEPLGRKGNQ